MNKAQLVDALAARLGDRRTAASAIDGLLETIVDTVRSGDSVSLTGFGVFEVRARAARVARNPRTGEVVDVPATTVPAFRPGTGFRSAVGGAAPVARVAAPRHRGGVAVAVAEDERKKAKSGGSFAMKAEKTEKAGKTEKAAAKRAAKAEKPGKAGKAPKGAKAKGKK